jgi:hypothetical protein
MAGTHRSSIYTLSYMMNYVSLSCCFLLAELDQQSFLCITAGFAVEHALDKGHNLSMGTFHSCLQKHSLTAYSIEGPVSFVFL